MFFSSFPATYNYQWRLTFFFFTFLKGIGDAQSSVAVDCSTEASTRERWQFGALTNRKATSINRDPSLTSLYYY